MLKKVILQHLLVLNQNKGKILCPNNHYAIHYHLYKAAEDQIKGFETGIINPQKNKWTSEFVFFLKNYGSVNPLVEYGRLNAIQTKTNTHSELIEVLETISQACFKCF